MMKGIVAVFSFISRYIWIPAVGLFIALESLTTPDHYRVFTFLLSFKPISSNPTWLHAIDAGSDFLLATLVAWVTYKALRHLNKDVSFTPYWSALLLILGGMTYLRPLFFKENAVMSAELLRGSMMLISLWVLYRLEFAMAFSVWALGYTILLASGWGMTEMASASMARRSESTDIAIEFKSLHKSLKSAKDYAETRDKIQERLKALAQEAENGDAQAQLAMAKSYLDPDLQTTEAPQRALEKSIEMISKASNQGNAEAQIIFADAYLRGSGIPINPAQAVQLYRSAIQKSSHPDANASLGWLYGHGIGVDWSGEEAIKRYKVAAEADSGMGYWGLADVYLNGNGGPRNREQGLYYLKKAADKKFPPAMTQLGWQMLIDAATPEATTAALGLIQDAARAGFAKAQYLCLGIFSEGIVSPPQPQTVRWWGDRLHLSAKTGYADSQWYWGLALLQRLPGIASDTEARTFISQSAEKNYHPAFNTEGELHYSGRAGVKDISKAVSSFQTAAQFNPHAMHELIYRYYFGNDVPKDSSRMEYYLKRLHTLAIHGDGEAQYYWAELLRQGNVVKVDLRQALSFYELAAENGIGAAFFRLGQMAENGEGQPKDEKSAFDFYMKAARALYLPAYFPIARDFADGKGTPKSLPQSQEWVDRILKGSQRGQPDHGLNLAHCYEHGLGIPNDDRAAVTLYQAYAVREYPTAMVDLARMLMKGRGVKRDPVMAYRWLTRAARLGDASAGRQAQALLKSMSPRDRTLAQK